MSPNTRLFPHLILRFAGGSFAEFKKTDLQQTITVLTKLRKTQTSYDSAKETTSNALFTFIGSVKDTKKRNTFIKTRRDLFNGKDISYFSEEYLQDLPADVKKKVGKTLELQAKVQELTHEGEHLFEKETKQSKKAFVDLLGSKNFQNGLVLASSTLPESARKYTLLNSEKTLPKVERALTKYLSRMYTKPSPFGSFTQIAAGKLVKTSSSSLLAKDVNYTQQSSVELNHALYHYLLGLLVQNKAVRQFLPIKLNTSIRMQDNSFVFLVNNFNRESFQRITMTPALSIIHKHMLRADRIRYDQLILQLRSETFTNATPQEVEAYIDQLLDFGFFEYDFGISGLDPNWDIQLAAFLSQPAKQLPYLSQLIQTLQELRNLQQNFAKAKPEMREKLLKTTFKQFRDTCFILHKAAELPKKEHASFKDGYERKLKRKKEKESEIFTFTYFTEFTFKPKQLLYEDTYINETIQVNDELEKPLASLADLLNHVEALDRCIEDMKHLVTFFKSTYGEQVEVDLLVFYEAYSRYLKESKKQHVKDSLVKQQQKITHERVAQLLQNIQDQLQNQDEIALMPETIAHIPVAKKSPGASFSAQFQTYDTDTQERVLVLNEGVAGFGKTMSRFLPLLSEDVTTAMRLWNNHDFNQVLLAELTDSSVFNADLHPPLLPYQLRVPGGYNSAPKQKQRDILDICIIYKDNNLVLKHKTSKKLIYVLDLGFQGIAGRSELYNFLLKFAPCDHHNPKAITGEINNAIDKKTQKGAIKIHPRLTYNKTVVLQRKTWIMDKQILPTRNPEQTDWEYFLALDTWRHTYSIPEEIFVTFGEEKPQYISFKNPFLVKLFEKAVEKIEAKKEIKVAEMLPNTNQLQKLRKEPVVSEVIAQWYRS